jgi:hypothetical protein
MVNVVLHLHDAIKNIFNNVVQCCHMTLILLILGVVGDFVLQKKATKSCFLYQMSNEVIFSSHFY